MFRKKNFRDERRRHPDDFEESSAGVSSPTTEDFKVRSYRFDATEWISFKQFHEPKNEEE
jgi:hypothetical protein